MANLKARARVADRYAMPCAGAGALAVRWRVLHAVPRQRFSRHCHVMRFLCRGKPACGPNPVLPERAEHSVTLANAGLQRVDPGLSNRAQAGFQPDMSGRNPACVWLICHVRMFQWISWVDFAGFGTCRSGQSRIVPSLPFGRSRISATRRPAPCTARRGSPLRQAARRSGPVRRHTARAGRRGG